MWQFANLWFAAISFWTICGFVIWRPNFFKYLKLLQIRKYISLLTKIGFKFLLNKKIWSVWKRCFICYVLYWKICVFLFTRLAYQRNFRINEKNCLFAIFANCGQKKDLCMPTFDILIFRIKKHSPSSCQNRKVKRKLSIYNHCSKLVQNFKLLQ